MKKARKKSPKQVNISLRAKLARDWEGDPRKFKKFERKVLGKDDALWLAFEQGMSQCEAGRPNRNPYPAGKRREEYDRGYSNGDPMESFHGRNK